MLWLLAVAKLLFHLLIAVVPLGLAAIYASWDLPAVGQRALVTVAAVAMLK